MRTRTRPFEYRDERLRSVEAEFERMLREFVVSPVGADANRAAVLRADITGLDAGSAARSVPGGLVFDRDAQAVVVARALLTTAEGRRLATITCERVTSGGPFGLGGWLALWESGEELVHKTVRQIAQSLVKELDKAAEIAPRLAARRQPAVDVGVPRYTSRLWLERPPETWSLKDSAGVLGTSLSLTASTKVGNNPPILATGVQALWLTTPAYHSLRRTSELLAQEGETSIWINPFSLALGEHTLARVETASAYAIAVWPFDPAPYYWDPDDIVSSTFLRREGHHSERIRPVELLDSPWPPAVFLFPRTDADGAPLVTTLATKLELHSTLNGRQVVFRFDLARFGLRDVNELGVQKAAGFTRPPLKPHDIALVGPSRRGRPRR